MIEEIIRTYFAKFANDLAPELQLLSRGQVSWRDVYDKIQTGQKELIGILRRNVDSLDPQSLKNATDLASVNLGLLTEEQPQSHEQDLGVVFPSAETK